MKFVSTSVKLNGHRRTLSLRENSIGDKGVIRQIFQDHDYDVSRWPQGKRLLAYHQQKSAVRQCLIIDAGANIGASTLYFADNYRNSLIFAIEPDESNWNLLNLNTSSVSSINFRGAIADVDGDLVLVDPGRSDWGFMTAPWNAAQATHVKKVRSIGVRSILDDERVRDAQPLILKIDIEGGEDVLFRGDVSWMKLFPLIVIELHDWMLPFSGSSRNFIKAVAKYDFDFVHRGENIFLFNREILNSDLAIHS